MTANKSMANEKAEKVATIARPNENADDLAAKFILDQDFNAALGLETNSAGPEFRKP